MIVQPEKKSRGELLIIFIILAILLLIPLICCGVSVYGIVGPPDPPEHVVISSKDNLCLDFMHNPGSGENLIIVTHFCDVQLVKDKYHIVDFDKSTYLDAEFTMECPWVTISDIDGDGFQEIVMHQDYICAEFAHGYVEPTDVSYKIGKDGEFIVIEGP